MKRILLLAVVIGIIILIAGCKKKDSLTLASLSTSPVTGVTFTAAISGGTISTDGNAAITEKGVCWSTVSNPTIADSKSSDGSGTGEFTSNITGLTTGTLYYVRAYATNSVGTAYGDEVFFLTAANQLATLTTTTVSLITATTAVSGGSITDDGGSNITARGICWGTSILPAISGSHTSDGTGKGSFVSNLTGLTTGIQYYVRAYATNSTGTSYGNQLSFTANAPPAGNTVSIVNLSFSPKSLTVAVNTTVTWTNNDGITHTVTSDSGVFDSGNLGAAATFSYTFTVPGTYPYHCNIHPDMTASIVVQ
jgi:plastocyanin